MLVVSGSSLNPSQNRADPGTRDYDSGLGLTLLLPCVPWIEFRETSQANDGVTVLQEPSHSLLGSRSYVEGYGVLRPVLHEFLHAQSFLQ